MKDYTRYSYWLESCGDDLTPRPTLDGSVDADVAILGAGYSGLWTAYYLLKQEPTLKIVIAEQEIAGFGASGRNGAWCTSGFPTSMETMAKRYGRESAIAMHRAMAAAVDEVGRVATAENLDIDYHKGGMMMVARGSEQLPTIERAARSWENLGFGDEVELLDAASARSRVNITKTVGALSKRSTAVIHPGKLVRGLARVVERLGGTIYEQTGVTSFQSGEAPLLHTDKGEIRARTIVLCGEAYMSQLPGVGRQLMPVYSLITLTEPLSDSDWSKIGWQNRECVDSCRYQVDYLSKTTDGRILFGGRGAPYHFNSKVRDEYDRHGDTHAMLQDNVREWFPMLKDVKFTHTWGGPLGWPRDYMPTIAYDPRQNLATARGFTGNGVATANFAGKALAQMILGIDSDLGLLPPINHRSPNWEPEPFRFAGVRYVQRAYAGIDRKAESTGKAPNGRSLAERLTRH